MTYALGSLERNILNSYSDQVWFGDNVRRFRLLRGLSQEELQDIVGIKQGSLSSLEHNRGRRHPTSATTFKFAKALRCTAEDLLQGMDPEYDALRLSIMADAPEGELSTLEREIIVALRRLSITDRAYVKDAILLRVRYESSAR